MYTLRFRFYLPSSPLIQSLIVNGVNTGSLTFSGLTNRWLMMDIEQELQSGRNEIALQQGRIGGMYFDYLEVRKKLVTLPTDPGIPPPSLLLYSAYPNPFRSVALIPFSLEQSERVVMEVFDVTGRRVRLLAEGLMPPGRQEIRFHADSLPGGVYIVRLRAGDEVAHRKVTLAK
jgi:hypothetical protein